MVLYITRVAKMLGTDGGGMWMQKNKKGSMKYLNSKSGEGTRVATSVMA
jgi:hypothetical protein